MSLLGFLTNPMELMVVALIALLFFGNRLPSVMRSLGRGVVEFKKGVAGIEDDVDDAAAPKKEPEKKAVDQEAKA